MTTSRERTSVLLKTGSFLYRLSAPGVWPALPADVRKEAEFLLRHYPELMDLRLLHEALPMFYDSPDPAAATNRRATAAEAPVHRRSSGGTPDSELIRELEQPPSNHPCVRLARKVLVQDSDAAFTVWWNSTSSFLGGRRPREVVHQEPLLVIAAAVNSWEWEHFGG